MKSEEELVHEIMKLISEVPEEYQKYLRLIIRNFRPILELMGTEPFPEVDRCIIEAHKKNEMLTTCLLLCKKSYDAEILH